MEIIPVSKMYWIKLKIMDNVQNNNHVYSKCGNSNNKSTDFLRQFTQNRSRHYNNL
jgi:hypothetical protein